MGTAAEESREGTHYLSYLLRLWCEGGDKKPATSRKTVWRASLQDPHTGQRLGFGGPDELFAFLRSRMAALSGAELEKNEGQESVSQDEDCRTVEAGGAWDSSDLEPVPQHAGQEGSSGTN
jgi:hypothetical protein